MKELLDWIDKQIKTAEGTEKFYIKRNKEAAEQNYLSRSIYYTGQLINIKGVLETFRTTKIKIKQLSLKKGKPDDPETN